MTDGLKRWVAEQERKTDPDDWGMVHALSVRAAEHHIRAFCDEVEKRAKMLALANSHGIPHDPNFSDYSEAFEDLRCELLGP